MSKKDCSQSHLLNMQNKAVNFRDVIKKRERESNSASNPPHCPEDQGPSGLHVSVGFEFMPFWKRSPSCAILGPSFAALLINRLICGIGFSGLVRRERGINITGIVCSQHALGVLQK